jgi:subtilisin family serine protease
VTAVRVVVIDSGVHAAHPHVSGVAGGIGIDAGGREHDDYVDRLGHGTAVAAVIREKAPDASIFAVKVFDRELAATGAALVAACDWALRHGADIVNLSLGTVNADHEAALENVVSRLRHAGAVVVAAGPQAGSRWLPGALAGVWSVTLDWTLDRDECHAGVSDDGRVTFRASGFPRPIPGVPPEKNLKGLSFAVANTTGVLAALLANETGSGTPTEMLLRAISGSR